LGGEVREAAGYLRRHEGNSDNSRPVHRNFVWRFLWHQCQLQRWSTPAKYPVRWLDISPDGQTVALACASGPVQFPDAANGGLRQTLPAGDAHGLAFAPDGRFLATAEADAGIRLWDLRGSTPPRRLGAPASPAGCLCWAPDGARLASAAGR